MLQQKQVQQTVIMINGYVALQIILQQQHGMDLMQLNMH